VPKKEALKKKILDEAHTSRYSIHPSGTKVYHDLREQFWWTRMKRETARYVSECDTFKKVKADYIKARGLLQPLSIPDLKWEDINMNFIMAKSSRNVSNSDSGVSHDLSFESLSLRAAELENALCNQDKLFCKVLCENKKLNLELESSFSKISSL
jgi:hypothetical protein